MVKLRLLCQPPPISFLFFLPFPLPLPFSLPSPFCPPPPSPPQVNASPSLTYTTASDRVMKLDLISDVLNIVLPPEGVPEYVVKGCTCGDYVPTTAHLVLTGVASSEYVQ